MSNQPHPHTPNRIVRQPARRQNGGLILAAFCGAIGMLVGVVLAVIGVQAIDPVRGELAAAIAINAKLRADLDELGADMDRLGADMDRYTEEVKADQKASDDLIAELQTSLSESRSRLSALLAATGTAPDPAPQPRPTPRPSPFPATAPRDELPPQPNPLATTNPTLRAINRDIAEYANRVAFACAGDDQTSLVTSRALSDALRDINKSLTGKRITVHFRVSDVAATRSQARIHPVTIGVDAGELQIGTRRLIGGDGRQSLTVMEDSATAQGIGRGTVVKVSGVINKKRAPNQPEVSLGAYLPDYVDGESAELVRSVAKVIGESRFWMAIPVAIEKTEYLKNPPRSVLDSLIYDLSTDPDWGAQLLPL